MPVHLWECLGGLCLLCLPESGCLGRVFNVSSWKRSARMLLNERPQDCGTVIPQWNYNALEVENVAGMPGYKGNHLAHAPADAGPRVRTRAREAASEP